MVPDYVTERMTRDIAFHLSKLSEISIDNIQNLTMPISLMEQGIADCFAFLLNEKVTSRISVLGEFAAEASGLEEASILFFVIGDPGECVGLICIEAEVISSLLDRIVFGKREDENAEGADTAKEGRSTRPQFSSVQKAIASSMAMRLAKAVGAPFLPNRIRSVEVPEGTKVRKFLETSRLTELGFTVSLEDRSFAVRTLWLEKTIADFEQNTKSAAQEKVTRLRELGWRQKLSEAVDSVPIQMDFLLGRTQISVVELALLKPGSILPIEVKQAAVPCLDGSLHERFKVDLFFGNQGGNIQARPAQAQTTR